MWSSQLLVWTLRTWRSVLSLPMALPLLAAGEVLHRLAAAFFLTASDEAVQLMTSWGSTAQPSAEAVQALQQLVRSWPEEGWASALQRSTETALQVNTSRVARI